jgi:queuine/archaeosine tRNA-ribosyltransferase
MLGQHEENLTALIHLGVLMYDSFLPFYPAVMSELMRNAGCIREDADQYQEKASSLAAAGS